jgi:hypothetical protein
VKSIYIILKISKNCALCATSGVSNQVVEFGLDLLVPLKQEGDVIASFLSLVNIVRACGCGEVVSVLLSERMHGILYLVQYRKFHAVGEISLEPFERINLVPYSWESSWALTSSVRNNDVVVLGVVRVSILKEGHTN